MHEAEKQQMTEALAVLAQETTASEKELRKTLAQFQSKALRAACYHLQLRVVKSGPERNDFKNGYLDLLGAHYKTKTQATASAYTHVVPVQQEEAVLGVGQTSALYTNWRRKTKACGLRLVNVLCYELNVARVCDLMSQSDGDVRLTDDQPAVLAFWESIAKEFSIPRNAYGLVRFEHECFQAIDPSQIIRHDAKKLQGMWKEMTSKYAQTKKNVSMKVSKPSREDFLKGCARHFDVFYMYMWIQERPALEGIILGMPSDVRVQEQTPIVNSRQSQNTEKPPRPGKRSADEMRFLHSDTESSVGSSFPRALSNKAASIGNSAIDRGNTLVLPYPHGSDEEREVPHITIVPIEWETKNRGESMTSIVSGRLSDVEDVLAPSDDDGYGPDGARSRLLSLQMKNECSRRVEEQYERAMRMVSRLLAMRADAEKQSCQRELLKEIEDDLAYTLAWKRQCRREMSAQRF